MHHHHYHQHDHHHNYHSDGDNQHNHPTDYYHGESEKYHRGRFHHVKVKVSGRCSRKIANFVLT